MYSFRARRGRNAGPGKEGEEGYRLLDLVTGMGGWSCIAAAAVEVERLVDIRRRRWELEEEKSIRRRRVVEKEDSRNLAAAVAVDTVVADIPGEEDSASCLVGEVHCIRCAAARRGSLGRDSRTCSRLGKRRIRS
jgi:hypothetical protein